jgi:hypothetical protein
MTQPDKFTEDEEKAIHMIANAIADKVEAAFAKRDAGKANAEAQPPPPPPPKP